MKFELDTGKKEERLQGSKVRVDSIDTLKAWAIFIIILSHNSVMGQGGVGNCIFFAAAGFMAAAPFSETPFEKRFSSVRDILLYYIKKIIRIFPSFWIIILLAYAIYPGLFFSSRQELVSLMLVKNINGQNAHIWFLQNILALYFLTPFIGLLLRLIYAIGAKAAGAGRKGAGTGREGAGADRKGNGTGREGFEVRRKVNGADRFTEIWPLLAGAILILVAVLKVSFSLPAALLSKEGQPATIFLGQFLIGMAFAYLWRFLSTKKEAFDRKGFRILSDILILVLILLPVYTCKAALLRLAPAHADYRIGWDSPLLCALAASLIMILLLLNQKGVMNRIMSFRPFAIMGRVSFGIYLVHWYIIPLLPIIPGKYARAFTCYLLSLGIALILYALVEKPISVLIKTKSLRSFATCYTKMGAGLLAIALVLTGTLSLKSGLADFPGIGPVTVQAATRESYDYALDRLEEAGYKGTAEGDQDQKSRENTDDSEEESVENPLSGQALVDMLNAASGWQASLKSAAEGLQQEKDFDPSQTMTRGQLAAVLYDCAGNPVVKEECPYQDVPAELKSAVTYLEEESALFGMNSQFFYPDGPATDMAAAYAIDQLFRTIPPYDAGYGEVKYHESQVTAVGAPMTAADITVEQFLDSVQSFVSLAAAGGYVYGDSGAIPPCADGISACDRLVARALWDLGFTDQKSGGWQDSGCEESYLLSHGWCMSNNAYDIHPGSIVAVGDGASDNHTFVVISYDPSTGQGTKFDHGNTGRIQAGCSFDFTSFGPGSWMDGKNIYAVYNLPSVGIGKVK